MASTSIEIGAEIPSVTKSVTTASILQFESCAIIDRENIHNNEELAKERLGTTYTWMTEEHLMFKESMRKFFGPDVFHHPGSVNLKFLRPVKNGDTVTVTGKVTSQRQVDQGTEIVVELECHNQNQDRTAAGIATATV